VKPKYAGGSHCVKSATIRKISAGDVRLPPGLILQAELGSTLFRSRREERRPLLFDLRTTTLGALDLALLMFGQS
jgi:hypothetical protein